MWWESLLAELLDVVVAVATVVGGVAGAAAGVWLASVLTGSAMVGVIALFVGLVVGAKSTRLLVAIGIDWLEQLMRSA